MEKYNYAPFYVGQKVIGNPAYPHMVRNGLIYTITSCRLSINPSNGTGPYWYVGVSGEIPDHDWLAPYIFLPIQKFSVMTFSEIKEVETKQLLLNN